MAAGQGPGAVELGDSPAYPRLTPDCAMPYPPLVCPAASSHQFHPHARPKRTLLPKTPRFWEAAGCRSGSALQWGPVKPLVPQTTPCAGASPPAACAGSSCASDTETVLTSSSAAETYLNNLPYKSVSTTSNCTSTEPLTVHEPCTRQPWRDTTAPGAAQQSSTQQHGNTQQRHLLLLCCRIPSGTSEHLLIKPSAGFQCAASTPSSRQVTGRAGHGP